MPQTDAGALRKIVWSVDPFDEHSKLLRTAARFLEELQKRTNIEVQPTYVLDGAALNPASFRPDPDLLSIERKAAQKALEKIISEIDVPQVQKPTILLRETNYSEDPTESLIQYAVSVNADMIVVGTHARRGMSRFLLGSFAEKLIMKSRVPVLVLGARIKQFHPLSQIVFPTEFGAESKIVFRRVIRLARSLQAKLTLFHSVSHPVEAAIQSSVYLLGGGWWTPVQPYFGNETTRQTRRAKAWSLWATQQGVVTDYVIHTSPVSITQAITTLAKKKKAGMIAMEMQGGPISSAILGSVTRQVIRTAGCPVCVFRPLLVLEKDRTEPKANLRVA